MSEREEHKTATEFLDEYPELRRAMSGSHKFSEMLKRLPPPLLIDGEKIFIEHGDHQISGDELYYNALLRGARQDEPNDVYRDMYRDIFEELDDRLKSVIEDQAKKQ